MRYDMLVYDYECMICAAKWQDTDVASTEGNVSVPERNEKLGLNVYRYPD